MQKTQQIMYLHHITKSTRIVRSVSHFMGRERKEFHTPFWCGYTNKYQGALNLNGEIKNG